MSEHSAGSVRNLALHLDALGSSEWGIYFSSYTDKWFVSARGLNLTNGTFLSGVTAHRDSPEQALVAFMERLRNEGQQRQVVAVESRGQRRHYRWNGVTFAEVPDFLLPWADNTSAVSAGIAP